MVKSSERKTRSTATAVTRAEYEINYGPLPTLVGYQVRRAYSRLFQTFTEMLDEHGLAPGQYSVLQLIGLNPGLSQMALADATAIDRSTIVPITDRFAKAGWVRRTRRREDRRVYSLKLTPAGEAVLKLVQPLIEAHETRLVAALNPEERATLRSLLERIADRAPTDVSPARQPAKAKRARKRSTREE